jgi:hypothetical protein
MSEEQASNRANCANFVESLVGSGKSDGGLCIVTVSRDR